MKKNVIVILFIVFINSFMFSQKSKNEELYMLAKEAEIKENYQLAVNLYDRMRVVYPDDCRGHVGFAFATYNIYNNEQVTADYYIWPIQVCDIAIQIGGCENTAYFVKTICLLEMKEYEEVIRCCNILIKENPLYDQAYFMRGKAKAGLGDYRGAISDFSKTINIDNEDDSAYYQRGVSYLMLNRDEEACLDFSKAGELGHKRAYEMIRRYCQ